MTNRIGWIKRMVQMVGFARFVAHRYRHDNVSRMAAALSYTSLLSLVPLLSIALAVLAAFPSFGDVRAQMMDWAFANLVPAVGSIVQEQMNRFIANAGRLTAIGVVGLGVSAIMLLVTIESAFNSIFRVERDRSAISRLLVYWTVLTLGPLLMGAALSLQGYVTAANRWQLARSVSPYLAAPLPFILTTATFTIMFASLPNRRVRLGDAFAGAIASSALFAGLRWGFGLYVTSSEAYTNLYGAVAVVPIFLLWMFLSWAVVLIGAQVTAALPEWRAGRHPGEHGPQAEHRLNAAHSAHDEALQRQLDRLTK